MFLGAPGLDPRKLIKIEKHSQPPWLIGLLAAPAPPSGGPRCISGANADGLREALKSQPWCRQSQRRAERGLNAIGSPHQVEESAPVRSDFDGKWGFRKVHEAAGAGSDF